VAITCEHCDGHGYIVIDGVEQGLCHYCGGSGKGVTNLTAATALFAEVLMQYRNVAAPNYEYVDGGASLNKCVVAYRRRWCEITGMEVPE